MRVLFTLTYYRLFIRLPLNDPLLNEVRLNDVLLRPDPYSIVDAGPAKVVDSPHPGGAVPRGTVPRP